jgi:2,4-dichlorophenol 6-monooxygenase
VISIGPAGCDAHDLYADWYHSAEIAEAGCLVVRPDMHVAWRAPALADEPTLVLAKVFERLLGYA